jgi:hypothetical protein
MELASSANPPGPSGIELANAIIGVIGDVLLVIALIVAWRTWASASGARAEAMEADRRASQDREKAAVGRDRP